MVVGSSPVALIETLDIAPCLGKNFLDIQANIESRLTLKRLRDMARTSVKPTVQISPQNSAKSVDQLGQMVEFLFTN